MALPNRVSAALTQEQSAAALSALDTVRQNLSFLITLSQEEKRSLPRIDAGGQPWASAILELATRNQDFLPRGFDLEEMRRDVNLWSALIPIQQAVTQLAQLVDNTYTAVAADAYSAALAVYALAKHNNIGTDGLDDLMDELGKRFAKKTGKKPTDTQNPAA